MNNSKFTAAKLTGLTAVDRGTKTSSDVRPAITTARGMNKFVMNASASQLMGCGHGDRVVMFALPNAENINEKFFIAVSPKEDLGCKLASAGNKTGVGRPQNFNYASIWSQMLSKDVNAAPMGERALIGKGLMDRFATQKGRDGELCYAMLATKRVEYGLELVKDDKGEIIPVEIDGIIYDKIFALVDPVDLQVEAGVVDVTKMDEAETPTEPEGEVVYEDTEEETPRRR